MIAIKAENIGKQFGQVTALEGISFNVEKGELFGLIGPDGAGKTTLFRILTTLLLPGAGSAEVAGLDVVRDYKNIRKQIGYMPGRFSLYQDLTVEENLRFFATIFGVTVEKNYGLIKDIYQQIEPFRKRRAGQLSGGMKQKLALCCALIHEPKVLFLDEPTTGVDAVSRREFWDMLQKLQKKGIPILVSTPYMDEADRCERVGLIQQGKILAIDTPSGITAQFKKPLYAVRSDNTYKLLQDLREFTGVDLVYPFGDNLHATAPVALDQQGLYGFLSGRGHESVEIREIEADIEDCFIGMMVK